jgi:hypothetical protein
VSFHFLCSLSPSLPLLLVSPSASDIFLRQPKNTLAVI